LLRATATIIIAQKMEYLTLSKERKIIDLTNDSCCVSLALNKLHPEKIFILYLKFFQFAAAIKTNEFLR
jgi:hypothetical protein